MSLLLFDIQIFWPGIPFPDHSRNYLNGRFDDAILLNAFPFEISTPAVTLRYKLIPFPYIDAQAYLAEPFNYCAHEE